MAEAEGRKRGLLLKRSEWLRMWNRRHVILSPATLSWYDGTTLKGSLHLDAWTKVVVDRERQEISLQWPDAHPNRNVFFRCTDGLEELINWRRAFEAAARPEQTGVYRGERMVLEGSATSEGSDGPWMSASRRPTRPPRAASAYARLTA